MGWGWGGVGRVERTAQRREEAGVGSRRERVAHANMRHAKTEWKQKAAKVCKGMQGHAKACAPLVHVLHLRHDRLHVGGAHVEALRPPEPAAPPRGPPAAPPEAPLLGRVHAVELGHLLGRVQVGRLPALAPRQADAAAGARRDGVLAPAQRPRPEVRVQRQRRGQGHSRRSGSASKVTGVAGRPAALGSGPGPRPEPEVRVSVSVSVSLGARAGASVFGVRRSQVWKGGCSSQREGVGRASVGRTRTSSASRAARRAPSARRP